MYILILFINFIFLNSKKIIFFFYSILHHFLEANHLHINSRVYLHYTTKCIDNIFKKSKSSIK
jgi:hypothetical protein